MTLRALVLTALPAVGLVGCDHHEAAELSARDQGVQQALLVAELETRLADRFSEDARVGLDKMELCLKRFAHTRRAANADAMVELLESEHSAILEVLQAEELHTLGIDLVDEDGKAVERLELEIEYNKGQLEYAWDQHSLEVLRHYAVKPDLKAQLWCESDEPPRGWSPRTPPPLAEGARKVHLNDVLQRGRLKVKMGLTSAGRLVPEG